MGYGSNREFPHILGGDPTIHVLDLILIHQSSFAPGMTDGTLATQPSARTNETYVLRPWEEITGELYGIADADEGIIVALSQEKIVFQPQSAAADIVVDELEDEEGSNISLLRTDCRDQPIRVQIHDS